MSQLVWEEDIDVFKPNPGPLDVIWHLKRVSQRDPLEKKFQKTLSGTWKVSLAWVHRLSDRKYCVRTWHDNRMRVIEEGRTFRSLKQAKAYAVAIITLEN